MNYSPFIVLECAHGDQNLVYNTEFFTVFGVQFNYVVELQSSFVYFFPAIFSQQRIYQASVG